MKPHSFIWIIKSRDEKEEREKVDAKIGKIFCKKKKKWGIFLLRNQQEFPASDSIAKLHGQFCRSSIKHSIDLLVSAVRTRSKINLDSWPMSSEQEMTTKKERKCQMFNPFNQRIHNVCEILAWVLDFSNQNRLFIPKNQFFLYAAYWFSPSPSNDSSLKFT